MGTSFPSPSLRAEMASWESEVLGRGSGRGWSQRGVWDLSCLKRRSGVVRRGGAVSAPG